MEPKLLLSTPRFEVYEHKWTPPGRSPLTKATIRHPGAVVILPLLPEGRVCLIRNHRIAVGKTLIELPAGTLISGEEPRACAYRELQEETGYRAGRMEPLREFYVSPGILDEKMHLFVASDLTPGPADLEPDESIETLAVSWEEALGLIASRQIEDAKTLVALLLWDRQQNK